MSAPFWPSGTTKWAVARRYMSAESIANALADPVVDPEEVMAIEVGA